MRPPAGQLPEGALDFFLRSLIDDVRDDPVGVRRKELCRAIEQMGDPKSAHADQGGSAAHRSTSQSVTMEEMSMGGIDKAPTRRYWPVVTSIPRLRTNESQSMVAREP